jgi:hypothetical protein
MITDEEAAKADAEYAALPGTPADRTHRFDISECSTTRQFHKVMGPLSDKWKAEGMKWFRVTAPRSDEGHVYIEGWWEKPYKEAPLDRTAAGKEVKP